MIRALFLFIKLAVFVSIAIWIANRPGDVSLLWNGLRIDTSFGFALIVAVLFILLGIFILDLVKKINTLPKNMQKMRQSQRKISGYNALTRTLVALGEGNEKIALRTANRAQKLLDNDPVSTVLAAQAAQLAGQQEKAALFFKQLTENPKTAFLGWRGLMQQARHHKAFDQAIIYGKKAQALQNHAPLLLKELFDIQSDAGQEKEALLILKQLRQINAIDTEEYQKLQSDLHLALANISLRQSNLDTALKHAEEAFNALPKSGLPLYVDLLIKKKKNQQAIKLIEKNWFEIASMSLGDLYCRLTQAETAMERAKVFEKLSALDRGNAASMLLYSEALINARIWGSARQTLKNYEELHQASPTFYKLMARLEQEENNNYKEARFWLDKIPQNETA